MISVFLLSSLILADASEPEIKQPYTSNPASGGFLFVKIKPASDGKSATASFLFYDENGVLLHEVQKTRSLAQ